MRTGAHGSPDIFFFTAAVFNPGSTEMLRGSRWQHRDAAGSR